MNGIACDRCGKALLVGEPARYEVSITVKAAYDPMEITREDLERDTHAEMKRLLERMKDVSAEAAMDEVFREFRFDLCMGCQKEYLKAPLPPR
jgi:hypothetical protein